MADIELNNDTPAPGTGKYNMLQMLGNLGAVAGVVLLGTAVAHYFGADKVVYDAINPNDDVLSNVNQATGASYSSVASASQDLVSLTQQFPGLSDVIDELRTAHPIPSGGTGTFGINMDPQALFLELNDRGFAIRDVSTLQSYTAASDALWNIAENAKPEGVSGLLNASVPTNPWTLTTIGGVAGVLAGSTLSSYASDKKEALQEAHDEAQFASKRPVGGGQVDKLVQIKTMKALQAARGQVFGAPAHG